MTNLEREQIAELVDAAQSLRIALKVALGAIMFLLLVIMVGWTAYGKEVDGLNRFKRSQIGLNEAQAEFNVQMAKALKGAE